MLSFAMTGYRLFLDGNKWCATGPGFEDLQSSPAGFGSTKEAAREALIMDIEKYPHRRGELTVEAVPAVEEFTAV
jgi:hypothetical protein